jgi:YfiH family protein
MSVRYHFFGKDCLIDRELKNRENLKRAFAEKNIHSKKILFVNQIHGNDVAVIDVENKIHGEQELPKADALVTNLQNVAICVITADCSPILFFDAEKNVVAATHAGWRGAKLGVIKNTVAEMKKLGAKKISAIIGPMIHQKSYEVSQEFLDDFLSENLTNKKFFVTGMKPEKWLFDLPSYVAEKLRAENVEVEDKKIDTYENEKTFFSFRRSTHRGEADCGRNVAVIVIN